STDAAVQGDLGGAHSIDDDAGRVRRIPDLELVLQIQRNFTEGGAFQADIGPLAVIEPFDVVGRADVHVAVFLFACQRGILQVGGHGLGFGNLLGFQAVAVQHVFKVHVAADIELHGALEAHAAVFK